MEEEKRRRLIRTQKLEDVPELIHQIQSLLPVKKAARTCILSKSWLHAWSTIPSLRFPAVDISPYTDIEQNRKHLMMVEHTLQRYIRENIPFEKVYFRIYIVNHELGSLADKCIRLLSTGSYLRELELTIGLTNSSFTLPYELFFFKNLIKMVIRYSSMNRYSLMISNVLISCVSLRVLDLRYVHISDEVVHSLLSTCSLLEKITLFYCSGLKTIKVRNLCHLSELTIKQHEKNNVLEIYDVPNIRSFCYSSNYIQGTLFPFNTCSFGNVTELSFDKVIMDDAFFDIIKSKFQFLVSLTLKINQWGPKSLDITSLQLKRLFLHLDREHQRHMIKVQFYAPKLLLFEYNGMQMPSLIFSAIVPKQIRLVHTDFGRYYVYDDSFFLKLREAIMLTSEFDIQIDISRFDLVEPIINMDDIGRGAMLPATRVEHLSVRTYSDTGLWDHSSFFDAFFSICHPEHVVAHRDMKFKDNNSFCKLMLKEVIEKKTKKGSWREYLKEVEIKNDCNGGKWETLTDSWKSFLDGSSLVNCNKVQFRLSWFSS